MKTKIIDCNEQESLIAISKIVARMIRRLCDFQNDTKRYDPVSIDIVLGETLYDTDTLSNAVADRFCSLHMKSKSNEKQEVSE